MIGPRPSATHSATEVRRAGSHYEHWDELYGRWKAKMKALIAELGELQVPKLQEYEPDEVAFGDDRHTAF